MKFKTFEEAVEEFYKLHDCISDDPDKEEALIIAWIEVCGHEVEELN